MLQNCQRINVLIARLGEPDQLSDEGENAYIFIAKVTKVVKFIETRS